MNDYENPAHSPPPVAREVLAESKRSLDRLRPQIVEKGLLRALEMRSFFVF